MRQIDSIRQNIETLRIKLNGLIEKGEEKAEILTLSQELDELVLEYYKYLETEKASK